VNDDLDPAPLDPEEVATAYVDGELDATERARVESDRRLRARADAHRSVRDVVAAPLPAMPADVRDQLVARALDAGSWSSEAGAAAGGSAVAAAAPAAAPAGGTVRLLTRRRPLLVVASIAAAAAVVVAAVVLTRPDHDGRRLTTEATSTGTAPAEATDASGGRSSPGTTAAAAPGAAPSSGLPSDQPAATAAPAAPAPADASAGSGAAPLPDVGRIADAGQLALAARRLEHDLASSATAPVATAAVVQPATCAGFGPPIATATTVDGSAGYVLVRLGTQGAAVALVRQGSCTPLLVAAVGT